jgi:hypothetical protein
MGWCKSLNVDYYRPRGSACCTGRVLYTVWLLNDKKKMAGLDRDDVSGPRIPRGQSFIVRAWQLLGGSNGPRPNSLWIPNLHKNHNPRLGNYPNASRTDSIESDQPPIRRMDAFRGRQSVHFVHEKILKDQNDCWTFPFPCFSSTSTHGPEDVTGHMNARGLVLSFASDPTTSRNCTSAPAFIASSSAYRSGSRKASSLLREFLLPPRSRPVLPAAGQRGSYASGEY